MIDTNELIAVCLTLVSNFANTIQAPPGEVPTNIGDVASYVVGTPNSPFDVQVTSRAGAAFGMRDGMIYYYRSPNSLLHERNPAKFQSYAGPAVFDSNGVAQVASNTLHRLAKQKPASWPDHLRIRQAEAFKGTPMPFFEVTWPPITPGGFPVGAVMEVDARTGRVPYLLLFDSVFEDKVLAETIRKRASSHETRTTAEPVPPAAAPSASDRQKPRSGLRGRSLSEWLGQYAGRDRDHQHSRTNNAGYLAVREIGTNSLPNLLEWLQDPDGPAPPDVHDDRSTLVQAGFEILGADAVPAVPELTRILNQADSAPMRIRLAICALVSIGGDALPPLRAALENPGFRYRQIIVSHIGWSGHQDTGLRQFVPVLARCAFDPDQRLAREAIEALGRLRLAPEISVPALTNYLQQTSNHPWGLIAINSIASFGTDGRAAVPALIRAHQDRSDPRLAIEAEQALLKISPEQVTNHVRYP
jgi:HEAT repeat protein